MARDIKFLTDDIRKSVAKGGKIASVSIMNSLSQRGPQWSGRFSSAWSAISGKDKQGDPARQQQGNKYKYSITHVKQAVIPKSASGNYNLYTIVNSTPYAKIALDLEFWNPGQLGVDFDLPYGKLDDDRFTFGTRPRPGKRGQLTNQTNVRSGVIDEDNFSGVQNSRSAPLDWYSDYASGGAFAKDFKKGIKEGLKLGSANPGKN